MDAFDFGQGTKLLSVVCSSPKPSRTSDRMLGQERQNETRDLVVLLVEREMAGVEQMDYGVRQIAPESLSSSGDERGIVPPQTTRVGGLY